jgi:REP element-mobilizing transposase RayT
LEYLQKYKEEFDFLLYAYVLMPTHVHLLIESRETPLSRFMHRLQFRYTQNYNLLHNTWGHLFQGRYKAILCEKDSYLIELSAYIHLNPVRSGMVAHPREYRWSSYASYQGGVEKGGVVDAGYILSQFSKDKGKAVKSYERYIRDHIGDGHLSGLYKVEDQRFLGSEVFLERIPREEKVRYCYDIRIEEIVKGVGLYFGIPEGLITGLSRNRMGALGRGMAGYLGRKVGGYSLTEMAAIWGRDPATLCQGIAKMEKRVREDKTFALEMKSVEEDLISP